MPSASLDKIRKLAKLIRYWILVSTTEAGSGHPTSSLSAVDLMTTLMFSGIFRFELKKPEYINNDRLVFSKGHAAPLLYALWAAAGEVEPSSLLAVRKMGSPLEGHPTMAFPFTEAATGSLGQGLSVGVGMALNAKYIDKLPYRIYVLLGDSEMSEGSQWEAMQIAAHYKLDNLIGVLDVNRLGQRGETMYGHNVGEYEKRVSAFGWHVIVVNGHSVPAILDAYQQAVLIKNKPAMIIAKTLKGKGIPYFEDKDGWHGIPLNDDELKNVLKKFGEVDEGLRGQVTRPKQVEPKKPEKKIVLERAKYDKPLATRKAYGQALVRIFPKYPDIVALDAEVSNSTYSEEFGKAYPKRFFEMFIAEQNMVGAALGFSRLGKIPFVSTFAAFFTRAFDQIRMSAYSNPNIKFVGSHAGVSIGQDGVSQMGLEDIAMFRAVFKSVVLYPCDAVSTDKLVEQAAKHKGLVYLRTTRSDTPVIYQDTEDFKIGGSKVIKKSSHDTVTVIGSGVTVFEALKAYEQLRLEGINIRVIDLYSIKPIDEKTLQKTARETPAIITVEDHYAEGGINEAVRSTLASNTTPIHSLAVREMPKSGKPSELLDYEKISYNAIIDKVREIS
ncbi:transketolase [Patescibacteria group bacterium]|nr:transketolase [Patescibacteria group bacterium]MBU0964188.1 transketolase [Patescibacteria group bacterium]